MKQLSSERGKDGWSGGCDHEALSSTQWNFTYYTYTCSSGGLELDTLHLQLQGQKTAQGAVEFYTETLLSPAAEIYDQLNFAMCLYINFVANDMLYYFYGSVLRLDCVFFAFYVSLVAIWSIGYLNGESCCKRLL